MSTIHGPDTVYLTDEERRSTFRKLRIKAENKVDVVLSCRVLSCLVLFCVVLSCRVL